MNAIMRLHRAQAGYLAAQGSGSKYIKFADPAVEAVLMAKGVSSDGIGITVADAEKVTSIGTWFKGNTEITSFDEFEKFTGVTRLIGGADSSSIGTFRSCSNLESLTLPPNVNTLEKNCCAYCPKLVIQNLPDAITTIADAAFAKASAAPENIVLPNLQVLYAAAFKNVGGIKRVLDLGKITTLPGGGAIATNISVFYGCADLELLIVPTTVTSLGKGAISYMPSLKNIVFKSATPPSYGDNSIYNLIALEAIYVPDASVDSYKTGTGYASYSTKIMGFSQMPTTLYNEIKDYL